MDPDKFQLGHTYLVHLEEFEWGHYHDVIVIDRGDLSYQRGYGYVVRWGLIWQREWLKDITDGANQTWKRYIE